MRYTTRVLVLGCGPRNRKLIVVKEGLEGSGDEVAWKTQPCNFM